MGIFEGLVALVAKIAGAGTVAQATAGFGIVVVGVTGAGAAGALPAPVQERIAAVIGTSAPGGPSGPLAPPAAPVPGVLTTVATLPPPSTSVLVDPATKPGAVPVPTPVTTATTPKTADTPATGPTSATSGTTGTATPDVEVAGKAEHKDAAAAGAKRAVEKSEEHKAEQHSKPASTEKSHSEQGKEKDGKEEKDGTSHRATAGSTPTAAQKAGVASPTSATGSGHHGADD